jgi:phenylalanyl-tRNA synthetase beta subunit
LDDFIPKHFACALLYIAGKIIKSFKLIDEYFCPIKKKKSLCYRIMYQSLFEALSPQKAFTVQTKIIGPFLESCLSVTIR